MWGQRGVIPAGTEIALREAGILVHTGANPFLDKPGGELLGFEQFITVPRLSVRISTPARYMIL